MVWYPCCPGEEGCPCCSGAQPESWQIELSGVDMASITDCEGPEFDLNDTYLLDLESGCNAEHYRGWFCDEDHSPPQYIGYKCWVFRLWCGFSGGKYRVTLQIYVSSATTCPPEGGSTTDPSVLAAEFVKTWDEQPVCSAIQDVEMTPSDWNAGGPWEDAECVLSAIMPE